jgi:hypothetical protein
MRCILEQKRAGAEQGEASQCWNGAEAERAQSMGGPQEQARAGRLRNKRSVDQRWPTFLRLGIEREGVQRLRRHKDFIGPPGPRCGLRLLSVRCAPPL